MNFIRYRIGIWLLVAMAAACGAAVRGQTASSGPARGEAAEAHAGIELDADGVRAVVIRVWQDEGSRGMALLRSEFRPISLASNDGRAFDRQKTGALISILQNLIAGFLRDFRTTAGRIHIIGSNGLWANPPAELADFIRTATGKPLVALDPAEEISLGIAGAVPRRERSGDAWVDVRNSSVFLELNNASTRGGYQILRYRPPAAATYDFASFNIPHGPQTLAGEVSRELGERDRLLAFIRRINSTEPAGMTAFKAALRKAGTNSPGLLVRNRVYLSGDIVHALALSLAPEERRPYVPIVAADIEDFARRAFNDPLAVLNPSLANVRDQKLRQELREELSLLRNRLSPQAVVAGAVLLKHLSTELNLREKTLWYARHGHLGCVLAYLRLQAEK
jgi:hypothetical protein